MESFSWLTKIITKFAFRWSFLLQEESNNRGRTDSALDWKTACRGKKGTLPKVFRRYSQRGWELDMEEKGEKWKMIFRFLGMWCFSYLHYGIANHLTFSGWTNDCFSFLMILSVDSAWSVGLLLILFVLLTSLQLAGVSPSRVASRTCPGPWCKRLGNWLSWNGGRAGPLSSFHGDS